MSIVPSGKRRQIEAQNDFSKGNWGADFGNYKELPNQPKHKDKHTPSVPKSIDFGDNSHQPLTQEMPDDNEKKFIKNPEEKESSDRDLVKYIYDFLKDALHYPPRRLEQFADNFTNEKLYPGGAKDVKITIPDQYYGEQKRLSDEDFNRFLKGLTEHFGLTFLSADREKKKIIVNMNAAGKSQSIKEEDREPEDALDEVYGSPKSPKKSASLYDSNVMIKESKTNDMFYRGLIEFLAKQQEETNEQN